MIEVERGKTKTLTLTTPATATDVKVTITHDWGDVVQAETAAAGSGTSFTFALTSDHTASAGMHKLTWKYTTGATTSTKSDYFKVYSPYTTSTLFFADYPELDTGNNPDQFARIERGVRLVIDTYCGQEFQFIYNKTLKLDGSGGNYLHIAPRIETLTKVLKDGADDITTDIEIASESDFYIRKKRVMLGSKDYLESELSDDVPGRYFRQRRTYHISGDFGWPYVPQNVEEAAKLLINDVYNQDSEYRKHNVIFAGVGPVQTNFRGDLMGTTGNVDADVLLMDYTKFVLDWV